MFIILKNYLLVSIRNMNRQKGYSAINIVGLAIGIASSLAVFLWVSDELSYDRFHESADSIYRCYRRIDRTGAVLFESMTSAPMAPAMKDRVPGISEYVRTLDEFLNLGYENETILEFGLYVDPTFLTTFSFPLIQGDPRTALSVPNSIVLSQKVATRLFADGDPMGKTLDNGLVVTGVAHDVPANSSIEFDFLVPIGYAEQAGLVDSEAWWDFGFDTYLVLREGIDIGVVGLGIKDLFRDIDPETHITLYLQPLTAIHLHSLGGGGRIVYVYVFSIVAILILLVACINFMNLATARATKRTMEIGLRKAIGASRAQLISQVLTDSLVQVFAAMVLAICLLEVTLPRLEDLFGKELAIEPSLSFVSALLAFTFLLALVAGSYPAFVLSSFQPAAVLKKMTSVGGQRHMNQIRKILVVFQFTVSVVLIIGALVIYSQLNLLENKDLGIEKENIVCIRADKLANDYSTLKREFLSHPGIVGVTAVFLPPVWCGWYVTGFSYEGKPEDEDMRTGVAWVDFDYADVFDLEFVQGRNFSRQYATDETEAYIVNEAAVKAMKMDSPIDKNLDLHERPGRIVGVVKDFHFSSLHNTIEPLVLAIDRSKFEYICIRLFPDDISGSISFVERKWNKIRPGETFQYQFFEDMLGREYRTEAKTSRIVLSLTVITVLIACLGLFGLAAYSAERHTKEIGIRKVLGASVTGIVGLLSKEFLQLVFLANLIAWPIAYFALNRWLENFAYRVDIGWWIFTLACVIAVLIAFITVSYQSIKAARTNPVEVLKYE